MTAASYGLRRSVKKARVAHRSVLLFRRIGLSDFHVWQSERIRRDALAQAREYKRKADAER